MPERHPCDHFLPVSSTYPLYVVTEADATAIREVYEREGELSAAIELRRFPGIVRYRIRLHAEIPDRKRCVALYQAQIDIGLE